jgi:dTDP-D-glucose 4,6-dehydratase
MSKARRILGFAPRHDLESGLRRYIEWLRRGEAPSEQTVSQILFDWRAA